MITNASLTARLSRDIAAERSPSVINSANVANGMRLTGERYQALDRRRGEVSRSPETSEPTT
ncbi:hypothetical protein DFJ64_1815 [Thermasporomyces composti]|uniref:Uncharacterized protein n=2 Tax=Thermasporomyces composti TaxID=696763 RepID=A0A3D9V4H0_THECX|nr:hypothetical protein DFJ64_1815 [Thermasporomyces composti]